MTRIVPKTMRNTRIILSIVIAFIAGTITSPSIANASASQCNQSSSAFKAHPTIWNAICDLQSQFNSLSTSLQLEKTTRQHTDKNLQGQINNMSSNLNSSHIRNLETQLQQANARLDVLYGNPPPPVETNQIILPLTTSDLTSYCNLRYNCVQPYSIVVHVSDQVTWINKDHGGHYISHTPNYEQHYCGLTDSLIDINLAGDQSFSMQFDKAGQYDYCVSGYYRDVHGIIFVKDQP